MTLDSDFVVVANRLPVRWTGEGWETSPGGLVSALAPVLENAKGAWVGWSGDIAEADDMFEHDGIRLHPVPLSEEEYQDHYEGFCNATVWPLYHDAIHPAEYHRHWWRAHLAVNQRFAEAAAKVAAPGGTVWVHDYQLQLVPGMLRELRPDVRIGYFLHIPFPPQELFVRLPWRQTIVDALLGADVVGFQTPSDARNFRSICRYLAGHRVRGQVIDIGNRRVTAAAFPITIDVNAVEEAARRRTRSAEVGALRASLGDPRIVLLGVDRLDYTKGIEVRLRAFQELLEDGVLTVPEAVMIQVAVPSREDVAGYSEVRERIEQLIGEINGEHGQVGAPAVHYLHRSLPFDELVTLYRAADVMLVTPFRDGMNLVAKEYVAAKVDGSGLLVLSEFAGAAHELTAATLVNPHDTDGVRDAIARALTESPDEQRRRMRVMRRAVLRSDVHAWAGRFLATLEAAET